MGLFNKLQDTTRDRIAQGKTFVVDESTAREYKKEVGISDKTVKKETKVVEKDLSSVKLYSFRDMLSNVNPDEVNLLLVTLLQTHLSGELDRIDSVELPKSTVSTLIKLTEEFGKELKRVTGA